MRLNLNIKLCPGMTTGSEVRRALIRVVNDMQRAMGDEGSPAQGDEGNITDQQGQVVGKWKFAKRRKKWDR